MDPLTIGLFALIAVMIFFMFRNSRKRRQEAEELALKMVPGAEIMTQHGIYGTLVSLDEEKNEAIIETTPGTQLRVHRQTLARVVEPEVAEEEDTEVEQKLPNCCAKAKEAGGECDHQCCVEARADGKICEKCAAG